MNQLFSQIFLFGLVNLAGAISTSVYISKKRPKGATALYVLNWLVAWPVILCILPFIPPKDPLAPRSLNQPGRIIGAIVCGWTIGGTIYVSIFVWSFFIEMQIHDPATWSGKTVAPITEQTALTYVAPTPRVTHVQPQESTSLYTAPAKGWEPTLPTPGTDATDPTPALEVRRASPVTTPHNAEAAETPDQRFLAGERYPQTRHYLLAMDDVQGMSIAQMRYAINEVYARYGATFPNVPDIQRQFQKFAWYHPNPGLTFEEVDRLMSDTERENVKFLAQCRELMLCS